MYEYYIKIKFTFKNDVNDDDDDESWKAGSR